MEYSQDFDFLDTITTNPVPPPIGPPPLFFSGIPPDTAAAPGTPTGAAVPSAPAAPSAAVPGTPAAGATPPSAASGAHDASAPRRFGQVFMRRPHPSVQDPATTTNPAGLDGPAISPGSAAASSHRHPPPGAVAASPVINHHRMVTRAKAGFRVPALFHAAPLSPIPKTFRGALADPNWRAAMEDEYAALLQNHTWDLVPRPHGANIVTGKWIFKHKFNADGSLERYKARWVLRGFTQRPDIDFDETFSPVVKPATVWTFLSLAVSSNWPIHQLDVKNAFLHVTLSETVYCSQPSGFEDSASPQHVCRLNKSLYGLKQAPRAWHSRFATHLLSLGFIEAKSDTSLFVYHRGTDTTYLLLYVDDIILTTSSTVLLRHIIQALQLEFAMKDLGDLHHFLGMQVQRRDGGLFLLQRQYMLDILDRAGMADCNPVLHPSTQTQRFLQLLVLLFLIHRISAA